MKLNAVIHWIVAAIAILAAIVMSRSAAADSVTLRGSTIPLREVRIEAIRAGELYYFDRNNQLQRRALDDVTQLGFDGLAELGEAENALAEGDKDAALLKYLQALVKSSENETQRLWLHVRLIHLHNARDEYIQAAGHAAAVFSIEPHASWRNLEPTCDPKEPTYAQAMEADELLREAARRAQDQTLRAVIARMTAVVQPIRAQLEKSYNGPPIAQNSTWSGYSRKRIAEGAIISDVATPATKPATQNPIIVEDSKPAAEENTKQGGGASGEPAVSVDSKGDEAAPPANVPTVTPTQPASPVRAGDAKSIDRAADEIDALLLAGDFAGALNQCESAGRNIAGRDIARLLQQWGKALYGVDRPQDAAVMYTRCAVLFPGSTNGLECLIETAMLYETVYKKPETAQRLLRRVIEQAQIQGREAIAQRARGLLRN